MPHLDIKIKNVNMSLLKGINAQQLNKLYNCFFQLCHMYKMVPITFRLQINSISGLISIEIVKKNKKIRIFFA